MTLIGIDGVPSKDNASNVVRPYTTFDFSIRLPPTLCIKKAENSIKEFFEQNKPLYNAKVEVEIVASGPGFNANKFEERLEDLINQAGQTAFGRSSLKVAEGGSIPFVNELNQVFPNSQFIVSGLLGPESNAHGPDEFLDLDYLSKLLFSFVLILKDY